MENFKERIVEIPLKERMRRGVMDVESGKFDVNATKQLIAMGYYENMDYRKNKLEEARDYLRDLLIERYHIKETNGE